MTGWNSNIDEVIQRFKGMKEQMEGADFSQALVAGVQAARAAMHVRIFNKGLNTDGGSLGLYVGKKRPMKNTFSKFQVGSPGGQLMVTPYEKKRIKGKRQIRYKDLEFTGALRRGMVVITENQNRVVCAIPSDDLFIITVGQEDYLKMRIFSMSEFEKEEMKTHVHEISKQIYDRIFNT